ncbi:MAG: HPr-rel-A system PqqD family peptide chaperone [Limnohabitans sp.]
MRYSPSCASLAIRQLGEEVLVFNPASGSTHVLSDAALVVLRGLLDAPGPTDSQALGLALLGEASDAELRGIGAMLEEFTRLGLAETRPS